MKTILILLLLFPFACFGQVVDSSWFDRKDYVEKKRGDDDGYPFVIVYVHQKDTSLVLKRNYIFDSTYEGNTYHETFYYKGEPEGPWRSVINGQVGAMGFYKNGHRAGERLRYEDGVVTRRSWFDSTGAKTGTWEEYDNKGKLVSATIYEEGGKMERKYNAKGILVNKTVYDDSLHMKRIEKYNEQGKLVSLWVRDEQGNRTIEIYNDQGKLLTTMTYKNSLIKTEEK